MMEFQVGGFPSCEDISEPEGAEGEGICSGSHPHVLELLATTSSPMKGNLMKERERLLSCVQLAVLEQLRNWGVPLESPCKSTRGRSKTRKSNNNNAANVNGEANRLVEAKLKNCGFTIMVPVLIKETCDFLREHITTEGIFRKSGSTSRVQFLRQRFMEIKKGEDFHFYPCDTVFDVASVLKQYLREMEVPLIPHNLHDLFLRSLEISPECSKVEAVLLCTCLLSEFSLSILTYLTEFLTEVVENSDSNRMSYENLAILIAPNIMPVERKKIDKSKELEHERKFVDAHTKVVEILIRNGHKLGCLSPELQKKVESGFSPHGSENGLNNEEVRRSSDRRRSGSLTRVLDFMRRVGRNRTPDTSAVLSTPDLSQFSHTPVMKSSKRRCLDGNMFSLQKRKTILDSIRNKGLVPNEDDNRLSSHLPDTPKSVAGFITCPQPVVINPSLNQSNTPNMQARIEDIVDGVRTVPRLSSSPKRCTLTRGRPNTLRTGLARPTTQYPKTFIPRYFYAKHPQK